MRKQGIREAVLLEQWNTSRCSWWQTSRFPPRNAQHPFNCAKNNSQRKWQRFWCSNRVTSHSLKSQGRKHGKSARRTKYVYLKTARTSSRFHLEKNTVKQVRTPLARTDSTRMTQRHTENSHEGGPGGAVIKNIMQNGNFEESGLRNKS